MLTRERALTSTEFHCGPCERRVGPRGGVTERVERWRRNGATRTWRRDPQRWEVPVKHGLYQYATIRSSDAERWHAAEDCPLLREEES